jgi:SsrA-binding protein
VPTDGRAGRDPARDAEVRRSNNRRLAQNRRARHEYDIIETFECGIALQGAEVKSLRAGQGSLQDAYARVEDHEVWCRGS